MKGTPAHPAPAVSFVTTAEGDSMDRRTHLRLGHEPLPASCLRAGTLLVQRELAAAGCGSRLTSHALKFERCVYTMRVTSPEASSLTYLRAAYKLACTDCCRSLRVC